MIPNLKPKPKLGRQRSIDPSVYFVRRADGVGPVKIGCSESPATRLRDIMAWAPYPLTVLATVPGDESVERRFHAHLEDCHSHREWFLPTPELEEVIAAVLDGTLDYNILPEAKNITRKPAERWSPIALERFYALRSLRKLRAKGELIPANIWRAAEADICGVRPGLVVAWTERVRLYLAERGIT